MNGLPQTPAPAALAAAAALCAADALGADGATSFFDVPAGGVLASVCTAAAAALATWAGMRRRASDTADRVSERLAALDARVASLEKNVEPLMQRFLDENTKLYDRVNLIAEAVYEIRGRVNGRGTE